jgi:hypothetical protein
MRLVASSGRGGGSGTTVTSSPFTKSLSRKDFLAMKQPPKSPSTPTTSKSTRNLVDHNVAAIPSLVKTSCNSPKPRHYGTSFKKNNGGGESLNKKTGEQRGYAEILAGLPTEDNNRIRQKNNHHNDDSLNNISTHSAGPTPNNHKPKVRFGDVKLRKLLK